MSRGKQPRTSVNKVPKLSLSEIKVVSNLNGQEIGLEAATYWRPRNRALALLIKVTSTENLTDLNDIPTPCLYILVYNSVLKPKGS